MLGKRVINVTRIPDNLMSRIESREVALWIQSLPKDVPNQSSLVAFLGLPWRLVLTEVYDSQAFSAIESAATFSDPMTRRRGFVQIIDSDPSRIELPQRCLPIYLLNGRQSGPPSANFENRLRQMTMLEELRRSGVHDILIISADGAPVPTLLTDLWSSGFRSQVTVVSDAPGADALLLGWLGLTEGISAANLLHLSAVQVIEEVLSRYASTYPEERRVIRVRDADGSLHKTDVTDADEPERPIAEWYSLIEERDLTPITPEELSEEEFISFFQDPTASWRPYAAGLPWFRDPQCSAKLVGLLRRLDTDGPEEDSIAYIASESGAGGTTLARALSWECARRGYPVLIAKQLPFVPDALPITNFLNRALSATEAQMSSGQDRSPGGQDGRQANRRHYETPWLIVFDSLHWQYRDSELVHFRNEMEKSGRRVCILVVTGPALGISFLNGSIFKRLGDLNHAVELSEARDLGAHLNRFLRVYGKQRETRQWDRFYEQHTVRYLDGIAAFWVTLSFWIQGQYDLSESIQEWIYRSFKQNATDPTVREAILRIAAMSSERLPLPEILLPKSKGEWPISQLLADSRAKLSALGLVRVASDGERQWALIHDILGRFLINALFYDFALRDELGFVAAKDAEHLRFLILRQISREQVLGERSYRPIGEDFATSVFKIDPDHGHGGFVSIWRDVLNALDEMPSTLRDTSRLFRHHTAVSRRRIAKLDENFYDVTSEERIALLNRAIEDINYALNFIDYTPGAEPNLNLLNSLAHAYLDLAEIESKRGAKIERTIELRRLANEATRRAYAENPTNSFVIETYVKNLLNSAVVFPEEAVNQCVEALGILYSALTSNDEDYRASQLGSLADRALTILFQQTPTVPDQTPPNSAVDVLVRAWRTLAEGGHTMGMALADVPEINRARALEVLSHPAGRSNMQVIRLRYDLISVNQPTAFKAQLELVEQLQATDYRMTPQLRLEYAILLFLNTRALEGDRVFRSLRQLWRENEYFVRVPERLRWLRAPDGKSLQLLHATVSSEYGTRAMANVQEFGRAIVPFRPEEHDIRNPRVGTRFTCHASFGHNGPFLRPVTVNVSEGTGGTRG
jgi:hypothetical protein